MEPSKPPRVFISYSWESEDHKTWVRYLGERLFAAGIEARLDQWFVRPGESFTAFMEQEVAAADFVLVVCTPSYAHKSNKRQGGVGYEQQIVSGQLMSGTARSKFIPILRKGGYEPGSDCAIPTHFLGIAWIEFRDDKAFNKSLEDLIRAIFSRPRFSPPLLGARPSLETITDTSLNRIKLAEADGAGAHYHHGLHYSDCEHCAHVIAERDRAIRLNRIKLEVANSAGSCYDRGSDYLVSGNYDSAIAEFNRAIRRYPDNSSLYGGLGAAYFAKGDYDQAIADYSRAIEIECDVFSTDYYVGRGVAYSAKGDYDRAIADYNSAIETGHEPFDASAYYNRGLAYLAKGDNDRAIADFRKSHELFIAKEERVRALADYPWMRDVFAAHGNSKGALEQLRRLGAE